MKLLKLYNSDNRAILDDVDYRRFEPNGDQNGEGLEPYWHYDEFGIRHPGWGLTATGEVGQIADVNCGVGGPYLKHIILGGMTGRIGPARVVNGNELDLRRENIRPIAGDKATKAYLKTKPLKLSGLYGVSWEQQSRRWVAKILHNGKKQLIGRFDTKREAAQAYNQRAVELYDRDALLNDLHRRKRSRRRCRFHRHRPGFVGNSHLAIHRKASRNEARATLAALRRCVQPVAPIGGKPSCA